MVHTYGPRVYEAEKNLEFKVSLGYSEILSQNNNNKNRFFEERFLLQFFFFSLIIFILCAYLSV